MPLMALADEGEQIRCCRQIPVRVGRVRVAKIFSEEVDPLGDVEASAVPVEEGVDSEGVAQVTKSGSAAH